MVHGCGLLGEQKYYYNIVTPQLQAFKAQKSTVQYDTTFPTNPAPLFPSKKLSFILLAFFGPSPRSNWIACRGDGTVWTLATSAVLLLGAALFPPAWFLLQMLMQCTHHHKRKEKRKLPAALLLCLPSLFLHPLPPLFSLHGLCTRRYRPDPTVVDMRFFWPYRCSARVIVERGGCGRWALMSNGNLYRYRQPHFPGPLRIASE